MRRRENGVFDVGITKRAIAFYVAYSGAGTERY